MLFFLFIALQTNLTINMMNSGGTVKVYRFRKVLLFQMCQCVLTIPHFDLVDAVHCFRKCMRVKFILSMARDSAFLLLHIDGTTLLYYCVYTVL